MAAMDPLQATLEALPRTRWRSVLHLGAGEAAVDQHARTQAERLWLVEGDPQTAARLSLRCARARRAARLVARPIAPAGGPLRWHCYNVDRLNGPLDATPLRSLYPKLQSTGTLPLEALSFADLLAQLPDAAASDAEASGDLLVLDVPGQAEALVRSIAPETLARFDWIVVRGGPRPVEPDAAGLARLLEAGFFVARPSAAADTAWSCTPWQLDRGRRREHRLREALAQARGEAEALRQQRDALAAALDTERDAGAARARRIAALEAEAGVLADVHAAQVRDLLAARTAAQEATQRALAERDAFAAADTERDRRAGEAAHRIAGLEAEVAELKARLAQVRAEFDATQAQLDLAARLVGSEAAR